MVQRAAHGEVRAEEIPVTAGVSIVLGGEKGRVEGRCSDRFQPVLDAFVRNFRDRGEVGA